MMLALMVGITSAVFASKEPTKKSETIVLVHGAWTDASAWQGVTPLLKAQGYEVIEVNLPGHGKDTTSFASITFKSYVDAVKSAIGDRRNIVLVGHSMAGLVISQVGEEIPSQIRELIYVAAFLPRSGESLLTMANMDPDAHVGKYLRVDKESGSASIAKEGIVDCFAEDAPQGIKDYLESNLKAEPLAPLATPVVLTDANFGKIRKVYVHTLKDHVVSYPSQKVMVKGTKVSKEYTLDSSHTPFISMPDKLAAILIQESK